MKRYPDDRAIFWQILIATLLSIVIFPPHAFAKELAAVTTAEEETVARLTYSPAGLPLCFPPIEGRAEAHVLSTYSGGEKIDPSIRSHPPAYVDVTVWPTKMPVFLVLGGAEPIVWRIEEKPGAQVVGIFLSGYSTQRILGAPIGVPVGRFSVESADEGSDSKCKIELNSQLENFNTKDEEANLERLMIVHSFDYIRSARGMSILASILRRTVGVEVASFQSEYGGQALFQRFG